MACPSSVLNCPDRMAKNGVKVSTSANTIKSTITTINGTKYIVKPKGS